ncbi:PKD domain-containing protein, partial [uncultured Roseivirga sp.]|uniref:PKD domain-containing protein n=1 Tax=uncultured Roseivirga sp. TaxID=543088 RepID=UPI0030DA6854
MKLNQKTKSYSARLSRLLSILFLVFITISCDEELPGEGSIPDLTPPSADFSYSPSDGDYKEILFSNLSISASGFAWDFGDGATSTDKNPTHSYTVDGTYNVKLTASDNNELTSDFTSTVEIVQPISAFEPVILNPGFDIQGSDDYRDNWTNPNGDRSRLLQITTSPVHSGTRAAKLPADGSRELIQVITVERNSDYILS